jgi:hypothetical protein
MIIYSIAAMCCTLALTSNSLAADRGSQTSTDEQTSAQWQRMQSVAPGAQIQVKRFDKRTVKGRFVSAGHSDLTISSEGVETSLARSEIRQVRVRRASGRFRGGAIGAAIGAASGITIAVALGGALTDGDGVSSEAAAALGALGAGIGLGLGLIPPGYVEVYKAPKR